jgi:hypothetical protein
MSGEIMQEGLFVGRNAAKKSQVPSKIPSHNALVRGHTPRKSPKVAGKTEKDLSVKEDGCCNTLLDRIIQDYKKYGFFI